MFLVRGEDATRGQVVRRGQFWAVLMSLLTELGWVVGLALAINMSLPTELGSRQWPPHRAHQDNVSSVSTGQPGRSLPAELGSWHWPPHRAHQDNVSSVSTGQPGR